MTLILNQSDWKELYERSPQPQPDDLVLDEYEEFVGSPQALGREFRRVMELSPGLRLTLSDYECSQDWCFKETAHQHPIQLLICLSGFVHCDIHPSLGGTRGYFSGSGISPAYVETNFSGDRVTFIDIEIEPEVLEPFFLSDRQRHSESIKQLFKGEDWKVSFYPKVTAKMRSLAEQMWNAPYRGAAKRMYLQAKVLELLAMHLDIISDRANQTPYPRLKPETIARLHYAQEILTSQFAHPPSLSELAQQVGVSDRTLQRGFQILFNTTVVGYLIQQRLEQAERLLRQGDVKVTEVANSVGYEHLGQFAAAFKRHFGITPSQCLAGKKTVFRSKADFR
ncbi:AraC family transcriptional regulator [Gloeocapsopsis sp. IPPAS B-1203]|nr:AraC family transcriptional regulator [Gloeocapsopsis sp. IPPAS B-1203]